MASQPHFRCARKAKLPFLFFAELATRAEACRAGSTTAFSLPRVAGQPCTAVRTCVPSAPSLSSSPFSQAFVASHREDACALCSTLAIASVKLGKNLLSLEPDVHESIEFR